MGSSHDEEELVHAEVRGAMGKGGPRGDEEGKEGSFGD